MGQRSRQKRRCSLIRGLSTFRPYPKQYFNDDPDSWWREVPVSVVGVPSGIFPEESFEEARQQLKNRKAGVRTVTELGSLLEVGEGRVELLLNERSRQCGVVRDVPELERVALGDYNGDDVAERLIFSGRMDTSDECNLGSGNTLGYGRYYLLKKTDPDLAVVATPFP